MNRALVACLFVTAILFAAIVANAAPDAAFDTVTVAPVQVIQPEVATAWQSVLTSVLTALATALVPLIGLLGVKLHNLIAAKVKNEQLRGMLERLAGEATKVVQSVAQQGIAAVDPSKSPKANGEAAKAAALASLKASLGGDKGLVEMKKVLGLPDDKALGDVLSTAIESKVHEMKVAKST